MRIGLGFCGLLAVLILQSPGMAQGRGGARPQARPTPGRPSPPYMQRIKLFEEGAYGTKVVLKNGLTVLVSEFHAAPVVDILTYVEAGRIDDPVDSPGVSVIVGSMIHRGTPTRREDAIARDTHALGGNLRQEVGREHSIFETTVPSEQWKKALEIQSDALLNASFEGDALRDEIEAIVGRQRTGQHDRENSRWDTLLALGFPQSWMSELNATVLRQVTRGQVVDFYKSRYIASRMVLTICGDVTTAEVLDAVVRLYEKLGDSKGTEPSPGIGNPQSAFRYTAVRGAFQVPQVFIGFQTAAAGSADFPALQVLRAILGQGDGSLLARRLRDHGRTIFAHESDLLVSPRMGYLMIRMDTPEEKIDRSEIAALTEIEIIKRREPDPADMERGKAQLEAEFWTRMQTVEGRANMLVRYESVGDWKRLDGYVSRLRQVKPEDVMRVAGKYLSLNHCSLLEYLPPGVGARNLTGDTVLRTFQQLLGPATDEELAARDRETVPAVDIPESAEKFTPSEVRYPARTASILRGPEIYIKEDHTSPLVQIGFFYPGGKLSENDANSGITYLMLRSMLGGDTEEKTANLSQQIGIYGGDIRPIVTDDYSGFLFSILSRNVEKGLDLLGNRIKTAKFSDEAIGQQKILQLADIRRQMDDAERVAMHLMAQALFQGHPYALEAFGTEASLAAATSGKVQSWYQETIKNRKPLIFLFGDTRGTRLASYFVSHFSGSRFEEWKIPDSVPKPLSKRGVVNGRWDKSQSQILIGFQAPGAGDEDAEYTMMLLNHASGPGGSLFQELVERQNLASSVTMHYRPAVRGGMVVISAATAVGNEEKVMKALEAVIRRWKDPFSYRDFRIAVNASLGQHAIDGQFRFRQITALATEVLAGMGSEIFQDYAERLKTIQQEDLLEAVQRVFTLDRSAAVRIQGTGN